MVGLMLSARLTNLSVDCWPPVMVDLVTLSQFESARPFTIPTPEDINNDGVDTNDRAVVNGVQTILDQFRGSPYYQIDLRVSRDFHLGERTTIKPFVEVLQPAESQEPRK